jgi:2,4-dienoyl-CoA reductase-like NADH-dependent reductase (Old Yellow Enzyme family)
MSLLFSPLALRGLRLRNRIVMPPMAMWSAGEDGIATDWHLAHYAARAIGGVGLTVQEATAVEPRGRISVNDLGLWDDAQMEPLARIVRLCHSEGAAMAPQLAHAGRKAFSPKQGVGPQTPVAPSAIPSDDGWVTPDELTVEGIAEIVAAFRAAARRAIEVGYDAVEIHAAHGYLLHEFLSPLSNRRADAYGGSLSDRARMLLEVVDAVREALPDDRPLLVRLSATDWAEGGLTVDDTVQVATWLKARGVDVVHCSSGGILPVAPPQTGPGYQVPFAEAVRRRAGIPTIAVGLITTPEQAEEIILNGRADLVAVGRLLLREPYWPLHAAHDLKEEVAWPWQYERGRP